MPDSTTPQDPAPDPSASPLPEEDAYASGMQTRKMTPSQMPGASGGSGQWQPPSVEEATQLFPNYEVLGLLGRGGMGAVYQARQIQLDRLVAIKLLPLEISADADFADRFRREARAMAKLQHPNIITVFDFGTTTAGHLFFAMEYVDGTNLHALIHGPGLTPAQSLDVVSAVCDALAYAHSKGIVHRDIKPANVMISSEGHVKMADFGLARLTDPSSDYFSATQTGMVMGTPDYMAPEQMRGLHVDHRADIFSLGVMIYEMLCGEVPRGFFDPPSRRVGVDNRVDDVVKRAMQQQPERRYQQTTELKADVDRIRTTLQMRTAAPRAVSQPRAVSAAVAPRAAVSSESKMGLWIGVGVGALVLGGLAYLLTQPAKPKTRRVAQASATPEVLDKRTAGKPVNLPAAPLEPGAIKLWDTEAKVSALPKSAGVRWEDGAVVMRESQSLTQDKPASRDAIVRAAMRRTSGPSQAYLGLRASPWKGASSVQACYRLQPDFERNFVLLHRRTTDKPDFLKGWPLPPGKAGSEWVQMELRAVGDTLTAIVDGQTLGTVRDTTLMQPGGAIIYGTEGSAFRDIVYVPLDRAVSGSGDSASAWQPLLDEADWKKNWPGKREVVDGVLHLTMQNVTKPLPSADGAVRARIVFREGSENVALLARSTGGNEIYKLNLRADGVFLSPIGADGKNLEKIGSAAFSKPLRPGDRVTLELRVQGDRLTALVDGKVVIEGQNAVYSKPGGWGIMANDGWFEMAEFQPLGLTAAPVNAPTSDEKWPDWIAEKRMEGKLTGFGFEDDGTYVQSRGAKGGPSWRPIMRDGAIRVTWKLTGEIGQPGQREPAITLRHGTLVTPPQPGAYTLDFARSGLRIDLHTVDASGQPQRMELKSWPLPAGFDRTQEHTLELRAVGDELSVRLNGLLIGTHRDTRAAEGGFGFFPADGALVRKVEYLSLEQSNSAASNSAPSPSTNDDAGFRPLFDGKTLSGWRSMKSDTPSSRVRVEDGAIVATPKAMLLSQEEFENFELQLEWKTDTKGNGGVLFRVQPKDVADDVPVGAPELQLIYPGYEGPGPQRCGALFTAVAALKDLTGPVDLWRSAKLVVRGTNCEHWIEGELYARYDLASGDVMAARKAKFGNNDELKTPRGHIGLQFWDGGVAYRNIRIRPL